MSRSRKKVAISKMKNSKFAKRASNKRIRRAKDVWPSAVKKMYCTWDICDWAFIYFSKEEYIKRCWRNYYYFCYRSPHRDQDEWIGEELSKFYRLTMK